MACRGELRSRFDHLPWILDVAIFQDPKGRPPDGPAVMTSHPDRPEFPVVSVSDLHKAYRRGATLTPVLQGVNVTVQRGECVFLAGPSGSGKTTLLSIIGCILSPDCGTVRVLGNDVTSLSAQQRSLLRLNGIGFVFQRFNLIRGLTAWENIAVPLILQTCRRRVARQRAMDLLDSVGLADKAMSHTNMLSAGQCQRIALARALAANPDLILADEPTAALDMQNGQQVMELLRRFIADEGKTAIVVTHDQRIFHFADRIFRLEDGRVVETK